MSTQSAWIAALLMAGVIGVYELWFAHAQRRRPLTLARTAHAALREDWFDAVSAQAGSEILAVQTLRNSLMSASMVASITVLGLMGTITLSASSLAQSLGAGNRPAGIFTPLLAVELVLLALLFAALISSAMTVRYYNHASFIGSMPVASPTRTRWNAVGRAHVRKAGILYSLSVRNLLLVAPALAYILHPLAGPIAAVAITLVLFSFDRVQAIS
jgi:hypothetical protein